MGRNFWIKRAIFIPIAIAAGIFIFGSVVMYLWNAILPGVLGIGAITFWQAIGILVLSKILFGGWKGGHGHQKWNAHSPEMREKWMHLSPEEREKMRAEWRGRCGQPPAKQE
jgi:hypothetical protein